MWVNSGSGNDLLPDGTKPLPESVLTYHQSVMWQWSESNFTQVTITNLPITYVSRLHFLKFLSQLPGAIELKKGLNSKYNAVLSQYTPFPAVLHGTQNTP